MPSMSRRDCLAWLARAASIPLAAELCSHAHADGASIPNLMALPNESARLLTNPEAILTRTRAGIACFSGICTHRRNKLEVNKDGGIKCPVHDSIFDLSGTPISGPASRPLTWYSTSINEDGDISVNANQTVAQGQWAKLPAWAQKK
ncbi:MAG TPA: Rieske (2Fe-2S) protein [Planctomycetota bacterium]|nr:Rieske (2Fe-2S) protein [Planctomycetota bacterium]